MRRDNASAYLDGLIAAAHRLKGRWFGHMTLGLLGDSDAHRLSPSTGVEENPVLCAAFNAFGLIAERCTLALAAGAICGGFLRAEFGRGAA